MAEEEKDEVLDKKAAKAQEKAARAEAKAQKKADRKKAKELNDDLDMDDETSTGGKIAVFFVTLIIILIWLAIIVLLIKCDVGGFGSSVLAPVLKDVPYVNKILPDSATEEVSTEDDAYGYTSIDDAVARIKELEKELADAQNTSSANAEYIAQLESQSAELAQYKQNEADFEAEKQKFYQEVVFSDSAPDIEEYKQYYESIDPADAEIIYRQVVEQTAANDEMDDYVKAYLRQYGRTIESEYSGQNGRGYSSKGDRDHGTCRIEKDSLLFIVAEGFLQKSGCRCSYGKGGREWETTMLQALGKC